MCCNNRSRDTECGCREWHKVYGYRQVTCCKHNWPYVPTNVINVFCDNQPGFGDCSNIENRRVIDSRSNNGCGCGCGC